MAEMVDKASFNRILLFIWAILAGYPLLKGQEPGKEVIRAIRSGDTLYLLQYLHVDESLSTEKINPGYKPGLLLPWAVENKNAAVVKFLLDMGASPDQMFKGSPLLIRAILHNETEIVKQLLDSGADPDLRDADGLTAVHWAVIKRNFPLLLQLFESGASLNLKDKKGRLPIDFVKADHPSVFREFLMLRSQIQRKAENWIKEADGPYVFHDAAGSFWFSISPYHSFYRLYRQSITDESRPLLVPMLGYRWPIVISQNYAPDTAILSMPEQMLAVGDLHGQLDDLIRLLKAAQVVDSALNWKFGKGYLVFLGDFTDRGSQVTELLWFVLHLRHQAAQHGGKVLAILGNHDMMSMLGDHRYLNPKYQQICEYFGLEYWSFFDRDTELGRFLRSLPVILKIGDNLIVHAGISHELMSTKPDINSLNSAFYAFNNTFPPRLNAQMDFLLRENGPIWYRGLIPDYDLRQQGSQQLVDSIAEWFGVQRIIIGHSEVPEIRPLYQGKVIPINVPLGREGVKPQALLWIGDSLYVVDVNGTTKPIRP
ncbi:MAG: metallophosphoesterase [Bacteroidales bacterium]